MSFRLDFYEVFKAPQTCSTFFFLLLFFDRNSLDCPRGGNVAFFQCVIVKSLSAAQSIFWINSVSQMFEWTTLFQQHTHHTVNEENKLQLKHGYTDT